jgi:glycosyltransferase involved in cell wall biosynthesis
MVVHNYYPLGEPRVQRQAEALAEVGAEVDVICLRRQAEVAIELNDNIRIFRLPAQKDEEHGLIGHLWEYLAFFVLVFFKLSWLHFRRHYQVVQVHNLPDFLVFTALFPRLSGAAVILDLHDLMPEFFASRFSSGLDSFPVRLIRLQERLSCRFSTHVITVSEWWRQSLIQRGVPSKKCSVVMNVANEEVFNRSLSDSTPSDDSLHLIYHGTLTHRYGIDLAVKATAQVRSELPNIRLTIHGDGDFLPDLRRLVDDLNLEGNVHFSTQLMPIEELPKLLVSADAGLAPYRRDVFTDGILPTKLMEYAALGLPTIVARTPAIEEYFNADMVEFFEAEDIDALRACIIRLYRDLDRRSALARNIVSFTRQHNWASQRANYLSLMASLALRRRVQVT